MKKTLAKQKEILNIKQFLDTSLERPRLGLGEIVRKLRVDFTTDIQLGGQWVNPDINCT